MSYQSQYFKKPFLGHFGDSHFADNHRRKFRSQTSTLQPVSETSQQTVSREKIRRFTRAKKLGKSPTTLFFKDFCGSGRSKGRFDRAEGVGGSGDMVDQKLHHGAARG